MKIFGFKELVKNGELTAEQAIIELEKKAKRNNGRRAVRWVQRTKTYAWLKRKANA